MICDVLIRVNIMMSTRKRKSTVTFLSIFLFCISHIFFIILCLGQPYKSRLVGALIAVLKLYLGSVPVWLSEGLSTEKSMLGKLPGWLTNLAALPMELGFSSQSSEGCLSLRSPMLHLLLFPLNWFSTTADQAEGSLTIHLRSILSKSCFLRRSKSPTVNIWVDLLFW